MSHKVPIEFINSNISIGMMNCVIGDWTQGNLLIGFVESSSLRRMAQQKMQMLQKCEIVLYCLCL